jgi:hypothetical protein
MVTSVRGLDLAIYDRNHQLRAGVIAKKLPDTDPSWAGEYYHNLLEHDALPKTEYFLLVLADKFHLWRRQQHRERSNGSFLSDYSGEATSILAPYAERIGRSLDRISVSGFDWLVYAWLEDVVHSGLTRDTADPALRWLFDSGLHGAIAGGRVVADDAL